MTTSPLIGSYGSAAIEYIDRFSAHGANTAWFHMFDEAAFEACAAHGIHACVEFKTFRADFAKHPDLVPIGVDGKPGDTGISIGDTIRHIATSNSWAVLKNIEQDPAYEALLLNLLGEIRSEIESKTGTMLRPQGFIFISSPDAVTPYHFDPEHNILLQLKGTKVMTQFPAGNDRFAPDTVHETYHAGGARELTWHDSFAQHGREFAIGPGQAVFVPVMAPHFVRVGPESSISLSITWRSDWSFAEADARGFNRMMRKFGMRPTAPGRWPNTNAAKSFAFRIIRRLGLAR